jgi:hypothetical protein
VSLDTEAGPLTIVRVGSADYDAVIAILSEAADWLSARGNLQWKHWHTEVGERMVRDRLEHHEVYLFQRDNIPVGTLTIQWSDPEVWGERASSIIAPATFTASRSLAAWAACESASGCCNGRWRRSRHGDGNLRTWTR